MTIQIAPADTALLVIDMQNGFCRPDGTLGLGGVDVAPMQASIPHIRRLVSLARERGIPDIWSRQFHYPVDRTREAQACKAAMIFSWSASVRVCRARHNAR